MGPLDQICLDNLLLHMQQKVVHRFGNCTSNFLKKIVATTIYSAILVVAAQQMGLLPRPA